ncbi:hypothetical protein KAT24_01020 [Candidatus Pacearchaeota archaeon]|nr:hypothetical protein [Candidatus Pacearchaeota archaeon]
MKKWVIVLVVFALLIIGVFGYALIKGGGSFKFGFSSATIKDAKFCTSVDEDQNPIGVTSIFTPDSPKIYIWFSWAHTMIGTEAKAVLIYETSNLTVTEGLMVLEDMAGRGSFSFTRPATEAGWPVGDYRVDLYLDDELAKSVSFVILICGELIDNDAKDECYFNIAIEIKDDSLCERIIESIPKNICHAVVLDNADLCEEITDSVGKDICYGTYAIKNEDSSICEKIIDDAKKEICYTNAA